jgi:predicted hotdog family 3-hydroxylacyl-ACP dehydratase
MEDPEIGTLVPHSAPMLLVRRVLEHSPQETVCEVDTADSGLFADRDGRVPAWVGLEYMAQCAAVHGGLVAFAGGNAPPAGMLLGTRRLALAIERFEPGQILRVATRRVHAGAQMLSFAAAIHDGRGEKLLSEARINIHLVEFPSDWKA